MLRVLALSLLCWISTPAWAGSLSWVTQERWVTVNRVIDGDTFTTRQGEKIRLLGINAPEIRHESSRAEPYGETAKETLTKLITGKQVRLGFDQETIDKYGRTLAHVYLRDGTWVNGEMLRLGSAFVYTFPPNVKSVEALIGFEKQAMSNNIGIWQEKRWQVLKPTELALDLLGQFRLIEGEVKVSRSANWAFYLGELAVSVPKKYRAYFANRRNVRCGERVIVRGVLRMTKQGQWFVSLHTKSDISYTK